MRVAREPVDHLRLGRVLDQLNPAPRELEHLHDLVGHDADDQGMERGRTAGVTRVRLEYDPLPTFGADHTEGARAERGDRKSTRLNSSHGYISYAVFCLKKKISSHPPYRPA